MTAGVEISEIDPRRRLDTPDGDRGPSLLVGFVGVVRFWFLVTISSLKPVAYMAEDEAAAAADWVTALAPSEMPAEDIKAHNSVQN